jgi:XTP/dITP diphosphohydrolase
VLGTGNRQKARELVELLQPLRLQLQTLADFPDAIQVEETGDTFAANAALKARQHALRLRAWVLGEDSGIVVDALKGAPGVYSARFAGPQATDSANNARLLAELQSVPPAQRTAHYVCHLCLADPDGAMRVDCESVCRGRIRVEPAGNGGFGYDPLFEIVEYHRTFGELAPVVKQVLSHRARAVAQLVPELERLARSGNCPLQNATGAAPLRLE